MSPWDNFLDSHRAAASQRKGVVRACRGTFPKFSIGLFRRCTNMDKLVRLADVGRMLIRVEFVRFGGADEILDTFWR